MKMVLDKGAEWMATEADQTTSDKPTKQIKQPAVEPEILAPGNWPQRIAAAWQQTVHAIIETGKLLNEAKHVLDHGEFGDMIRDQLPFGPRTAQRLMNIAEHPVLANATHASHLPASWMTLYELSRLPALLVDGKLADGTITPRLERADIQRKVLGQEVPPRRRDGWRHQGDAGSLGTRR
jgi:hypothetical protein